MKRNSVILSVIIGIGIIHLTGCGSDSASEPVETVTISDTDCVENSMEEAETDTAMLSEENRRETEEEPEEETEQKESENQKELEDEEDDTPIEIPQLPDTGGQLADFVPDGWELLDSVELDFNEDGLTDYVAVLEQTMIDTKGFLGYQAYPRILFAIAGDGTDGYRLDFQDINLIRTENEGGVFGDPYCPLTAEGTSFTTYAYGGSAWRWSDEYTYTYREGVWWLTSSEETFGHYEYTTDYSMNDWESGVGIRKKRCSDFEAMEEWEPTVYDMEYEVSLDEPMTLEQAGKRCAQATDRMTDREVEKITFAADVELSEDMVRLPADVGYMPYNDENCVLYTFHPDSDTGEDIYYLAMYCWKDKTLSVLAQEVSESDFPVVYKGKVYYSTGIMENVVYKTIEDGKEQITEKEDRVGIRLNRMEFDGSGKEIIFEYRYPEAEQEIMESRIPHIGLFYEISGDEIIAEVSIGNEPHPVYRMNTDGSECKKIGEIP